MEKQNLRSDAPVRIQDMPDEMRPREELEMRGAKSMSTDRLLAIVMRSGIHGQNVVALASTLLNKVGGLEELSKMPAFEIRNIKLPGLGPVKADELEAIFELGRRASTPFQKKIKLSSPEAVYNVLEPLVRGSAQEKFIVCLLDVKNALIGRPFEVALGSNDHCPVRPADIIAPAVKNQCSSIIVAHNHPSGDPTPSTPDIKVTERLIEAASILDIRVIDHIIFGRRTESSPGFISLCRERLVTFK